MSRARGSGRIRANRRGARILLWVLATFILAQLLGGLVLDYLWVRPRFSVMASMFDRLQSRTRTPEIIFMGSSRFQEGIDCAVLDAELRRALGAEAPRSFNAALPAGNPNVFERVFDELCRRGGRPKLLVVEISPETVSRRDTWLIFNALNLLDWRDLPEALPALIRTGKIVYLLRGRLLPLYVHRYHICKETVALAKSLFQPRLVPSAGDPPVPPLVESDPEPPAQTPAVRAAQEEDYKDWMHWLRDFQTGGMTGRRLERFLSRCRSAGVAVLLVGAPGSAPHRRAYTPEVDAVFLRYVQMLADRYDCSFTDWRDQVPDKYFCDGHHTYPQGAVFFSRRLAASALAPLWRDLQSYGSLSKVPPAKMVYLSARHY